MQSCLFGFQFISKQMSVGSMKPQFFDRLTDVSFITILYFLNFMTYNPRVTEVKEFNL